MLIIAYTIRDFFHFVFELFSSIFNLIFNLILVLVKCGQFLISMIGHLPTIISVSAVVLVIVCLLYKILGREGGQ